MMLLSFFFWKPTLVAYKLRLKLKKQASLGILLKMLVANQGGSGVSGTLAFVRLTF